MSLFRTNGSPVSYSSNTSKFIELQLQNDRLFRQLSYGHIAYDIHDLNQMRESIYTNQMLKHNIRINHLMSLERSRYKMHTPQEYTNNSRTPLVSEQELIRNSNLLSANNHLNSARVEYVTKYQLVDCKLVQSQHTPSIKHISLRQRLKLLLEKRATRTRVTVANATRRDEGPSTELKHAHREFLRHELDRIRTAIP
ncbi:hypothetical protein Cantr_01797 [Candida viswanathii]|uniref:Uncharacterized protein n=1 Tax=Candida viswanathii TaxID=5486 RepID=A0A367YJN5_9ASCO|nr:hypothetical protein Cantr_01797 [Candida viswanathii]